MSPTIGVGSFLKGERLFSVVAGLLNPSTHFSIGCFYAGEKDFKDHGPVDAPDEGYSQPELSTARKRFRASKADPSTPGSLAPGSSAPQAPLPPALDQDFAIAVPWTYVDRITYSVLRFLPSIPFVQNITDLTRQFREDFWKGLLTAALRLISSLSTESANHSWLLEQGALQAVAKILQHLPTDRMRSGQQEAALFVYRLFENHA